MSSAQADMKMAKFYENLLITVEKDEWINKSVTQAPNKRFKDWDLYIDSSQSYEVKADRNISSTGNIAIEMVFQDNNGVVEESGALACKATHFVIFSATPGDYRWWKIPVDALRNILRTVKPSGVGFMGDFGSSKTLAIRYEKTQKLLKSLGYKYYQPYRGNTKIYLAEYTTEELKEVFGTEMFGAGYYPDIPAMYPDVEDKADRRTLAEKWYVWTWGRAYNYIYPLSVFSQYLQPKWDTLLPKDKKTGKPYFFQFSDTTNILSKNVEMKPMPKKVIKEGDEFSIKKEEKIAEEVQETQDLQQQRKMEEPRREKLPEKEINIRQEVKTKEKKLQERRANISRNGDYGYRTQYETD